MFKISKNLVFPLTCGALSFLLGAIVIVGWHTQDTTLIQVLPSFAPMQYNTALGFLFSGIGLIALIRNRSLIAMVFGVAISLLGFLTLSQYVLHIDLNIDQLLIENDITTKTSHLGRMAPNTALCFLLFGLSLVFARAQKAILISLGCAVLLLSSLSFVGYLAEVEGIYGWGVLTRMAIHTAIGFVMLSIGLIYFGTLTLKQKQVDLWQYAPFTLWAIVMVLTLFSWYGVREMTQARNKEYVNTLIADIKENLKDRYAIYVQGLKGGLGLFYASTSVERYEWRKYTQALDLEQTLPGISGIGFIGSVEEEDLTEYLDKVRLDDSPGFVNHPETPYSDKFIITFIEPQEDNEKAVGLDIGFEPNRRAAAEYARDYGVPALTKKIELVQDNMKQPGFLLLVPVYDAKRAPQTIEQRRAHFLGWVYAPFIGADFLHGLAESRQNQIGFSVYDGEEVDPDALIYTTQDSLVKKKGRVSSYGKSNIVQMSGRPWTIQWYPTTEINLPGSQNAANAVFVLGSILAALLYVVLYRLLASKKIIAREVEKQTIRLERVNEELEKFAYIASHDLKAPMRGIDNLAIWIAEDLEEVMTDDAREKIDMMRKRIARLETLLEDILSYSRAGRIVDDPEHIDAHKMVEEIVDSLAFPKEFKVEILRQLPPLYTVRTPLEQVFLNLISNAHKHHDKNKGTIEISYKDRGDHYEFIVQDDGPGIPKKFHKRVFEMFQTLQPRDKVEGTGLGMSIIKKMVEWQDGKVWIESEEGKRGTAMHFTWPKICREERSHKIKT